MKLYRPVGLKELELILTHNAYPPRLSWQPIFYPVLNFEYARQIATRWNLDDELSGYAGFVTEFTIEDDYIRQFEVQNVGADLHNELWIPAEELANFNTYIQGHIQLTGAYYGEKYEGKVEEGKMLKELHVSEQITKIKELIATDYSLSDLLKTDALVVQVNINYWQQKEENESVLKNIRQAWQQLYPEKVLLEI